MPRKPLKLDTQVEHLSILDEDGKLDRDLEPDLGKERLRSIHRVMLLSRRFDQRLLRLQRQGRIGTFAPIEGQEAAQVGAVAALQQDDWLVPSFRETAAAIWRGVPLEGLLLYNAGYNEGGAVPEDQYTLPIAVPVATQVPHAVGIAYAMKLQGTERVAMAFFGDGATSQGDFHEALNFAAVFASPSVFVCQNNHWAISIPREKQTRSKTLAQKAVAYGMPGIQVDGNDVLAVYAAAVEAIDRARNGEGPTLIECVTYRMSVHTTADDPSRYRSEEEVEAWKKRDPIDRFQKYLKRKELLTDKKIEALEEEIGKQIDEAWEAASARIEELDDQAVMFDHVYAEPPPYLAAQRDEFRGESRDGEG